jgi:hypothetical protein
MADVLRFLRPNAAQPRRTSFVEGLDEEDRDSPATPNMSGIVERDVVPRREDHRFELREPMTGLMLSGTSEPGDLRLPDELDANRQRLTSPSASRLSFVEGLEPAPAPNAELRPMPTMKTARVSGPSPDDLDRAEAERMQRIRRGLGIAGVVSSLFGDSATQDQRTAALQAAAQANDPNVPMQRISARGEAARAEADAMRERGIEDEERALNAEYRRTLMRSMDTNANRREFEMERTGERDERLYGADSPQAQAEREALRAAIASAPDDVYEAFRGVNVDELGARDVQGLTDRVLRRIGQVPARDRTTEQNEVLARIAALRGGVSAEEPPPVEEQAAPARARGPRAPGAPAPTAVEAPAAPARRDRSLDDIVADVMAERSGQATSTGQPARSFTPGERATIARGMRSSRTRQMAQLAGGIGSTQGEAQIAQVGQQGAFTERDVQRASEALAPAASQGRQLASVRSRADRLSEAEFQLAMRDSAALNRILGNLNVENFSASFRAMTNSELRQQSGAAVTDSEAQRFFAALAARSFTSKAAFLAALARVDAERRANVAALGIRPDVMQAWRERTLANARGGQQR